MFSALVFILCLSVLNGEEISGDKVETAEQHDPMFPGGMSGMSGMGGMGSYGPWGGMQGSYGPQENAVNFDFQCKCKAKSNLPPNLSTPTDANAAAQQQINQLNDQIRRLQEQVRRSQQGQTQILSMADGLDCNCSGQSAPFSNFPFGGNSNGQSTFNGQMGSFGSFMPNRGMMGGATMGSRIFPGMFP